MDPRVLFPILPSAHHARDEPQLGELILAELREQTVLLRVLARTLAIKPHRVALEAKANASGVAQIDFPVAPGGVIWLVERVGPWTNSAATPTVGLYVTDSAPLPGQVLDPRDQVDYTNFPAVFADEVNPFHVEGSQHIVFQWTGCNNGDRCLARMQYRVAFPAAVGATPALELGYDELSE